MSRLQRITNLITDALSPTQLRVEDESHGHQTRAGSESHMKVIVASTHFEGLTPVARHRLVYALLEKELATGLHALSLFLYTPSEWTCLGNSIPASPLCHKRNKT